MVRRSAFYEVDKLVNQATELGFLRSLSRQDEKDQNYSRQDEKDRNYEVRLILKAKIDANTLEQLKEKLANYAKHPAP